MKCGEKASKPNAEVIVPEDEITISETGVGIEREVLQIQNYTSHIVTNCLIARIHYKSVMAKVI